MQKSKIQRWKLAWRPKYKMEIGKDIGFNGNQQFIRGLWELSQHGLAADYDKFGSPRDASGSTDNVFKLGTAHDARRL